MAYTIGLQNAAYEDALIPEKDKHLRVNVKQYNETLEATLDEWLEWSAAQESEQQNRLEAFARRSGGQVS